MVPQINALFIMMLLLRKEKCNLFQTPWLANLFGAYKSVPLFQRQSTSYNCPAMQWYLTPLYNGMHSTGKVVHFNHLAAVMLLCLGMFGVESDNRNTRFMFRNSRTINFVLELLSKEAPTAKTLPISRNINWLIILPQYFEHLPNRWKTLLPYYGIWNIMKYFGILWHIMEYYGILWNIMPYHGLV